MCTARLRGQEESGRDESKEAGSKQQKQDHGSPCLEPPEEVVFGGSCEYITFIFLFSKYILSTNYVSGNILGTRESVMNKMKKISVP